MALRPETEVAPERQRPATRGPQTSSAFCLAEAPFPTPAKPAVTKAKQTNEPTTGASAEGRGIRTISAHRRIAEREPARHGAGRTVFGRERQTDGLVVTKKEEMASASHGHSAVAIPAL